MSRLSSRFIFIAVVLVILLNEQTKQIIFAQAVATTSENVAVEWRVPRDEVGEIVDNLKFQGQIVPDMSSVPDTRGIPLIYIIGGLLYLPSFLDSLALIYNKQKYGGVVIDVRKEMIRVRHDPALAGSIIIVDENGAIVHKVTSFENHQSFAAKIVELLK
jgi:hypothetical protein